MLEPKIDAYLAQLQFKSKQIQSEHFGINIVNVDFALMLSLLQINRCQSTEQRPPNQTKHTHVQQLLPLKIRSDLGFSVSPTDAERFI